MISLKEARQSPPTRSPPKKSANFVASLSPIPDLKAYRREVVSHLIARCGAPPPA